MPKRNPEPCVVSGPAEPGPHSAEQFGPQRDFWWNRDFLDLMATRWRLREAASLADIGCGRRPYLPICPVLTPPNSSARSVISGGTATSSTSWLRAGVCGRLLPSPTSDAASATGRRCSILTCARRPGRSEQHTAELQSL